MIVDASRTGALAAFEAPTRIAPSDVVLLSVTLSFGMQVHLVGTVRRVACGDDDREYVGIEYRHVHDDDVDLLLRTRDLGSDP